MPVDAQFYHLVINNYLLIAYVHGTYYIYTVGGNQMLVIIRRLIL